MYFAPGEHPPPHFHVYYAEYTATVDIRTCEVIEGNLPRKQIKLVLEGVDKINDHPSRLAKILASASQTHASETQGSLS
jgi:hypothetical protein